MKIIRSQRKIKRIIITFLFIIMASLLSHLVSMDEKIILAADKSAWQAGNIISDSIFTDSGSMSEADIQSFLDEKIGFCDIWGTQPSEYGANRNITRAQYATSVGWSSPPYTCLNKYYEIPKTSPSPELPANNYSNPDQIPDGAKSAAWIIKDAATRYGINPKVLLVKIATESSGPLTTDQWPLFSQYRHAMGSHCPDSGPGGSANCDPNYSGFSIQMYSAAELLRWYLDSMNEPWWPYKKPYQTNSILWNVAPSGCGAGDVYVESKATAALYTYTPYQPNQTALDNMYGLGDWCSAYGNRNFWRVFVDWFGNTHRDTWQDMDIPRYLLVKQDAHKVNPLTMAEIDNQYVTKNMLVKFASKTYLEDGTLCLRTIANTITNSNMCIKYTDLEETNWEPLDIPRLIAVNKQGSAINPATSQSTTSFDKDQVFNFTSKTFTADGTLCLRDHESTLENKPTCILYDDLYELPTITDFNRMLNSRNLMTKSEITKINILTGEKVEPLPSGMVIPFAMRLDFGNQLCLRTQADTNLNKPTCILYDDLYELD